MYPVSFCFSGMTSLMPYMAVYMSYLGLTPFQTGIARGAEPLLHVLVGPVWGSISDRYSRHKTIIIMAIVLPAVFYFSTQFVPPVKVIPVNNSIAMVTWLPREHSGEIVQRNDKYMLHQNILFHSLREDSSIETNTQTFDDSVSTSKPTAVPKTKTDSTLTFILMILLISCGRLFVSPFNPILDSTVVRMTKEHCGDYGRQRMFAALGFSFSIISGAAIDAFAKKYPDLNKYTPAFYLYLGMITLVLFPISVLKFPHHTRPQAIYRNVGALFLRLEFVAFLLAAFSSGFSLGAINTFLFIFVAELNGPHVLMGLNLTVTALSEAIVMYFSKRLIQKLGHKNVFNLVIFCYALRHLAYSVIYNPWFIVPVAVLHGICFGAFWPTCTSYVNIIAPVGMEASVQSIAHGTYFGLGKYIIS